jgi:hypothetical protein
MIAIRTNQTNDVLGAGGNANCGDLPIHRRPVPDGLTSAGIVSSWVLTDEDLEALKLNGGVISLDVRAPTHSPLVLFVDPEVRPL